ncbi:MAG: S-layer homology domain-containing protein [Symploca sp. SIO2C1]|nr:S-layer homology domain-containing protein [Symploca sp. SIO2C1]
MASKFTHNWVIVIALVLVIVICFVKDNQAQVSELNSLEGLSDISVSDPYYDALKSLVEYYGVNVIFPDGTFRGDQTLTRGEFVSYLHDSLDVIQESFAISGISSSDPSLLVDNLEQITTALVQENLSWEEELVKIQARLNKLEEKAKVLPN